LGIFTPNANFCTSSGPAKCWSGYFRLHKTHGWYDFLVQVDSDPGFQQHFAGHVETGRHSMSDPALSR
jgi:phospholipase C